MRFVEVDVFGVYVAPISLTMVAAWVGTIALRRIAEFGLLRQGLAPRAVRSGGLHDRAFHDRARSRALMPHD